MIRNEKMYNKLNSMTVSDLREFAKDKKIRVPESDVPKAELITEIINNASYNFYFICKSKGYLNVEDDEQRKRIEETAQECGVEYDDIKTLFNSSGENYNQNTYNPNKKSDFWTLGRIVFVLTLLVILMFVVGAILASGDNGKNGWSQLTPEEQDRARWAYDVQQAADDYRRDHPGR